MTNEDKDLIYRVSAAMVAILSPLELGIPARKLLHGILWCFDTLDRGLVGTVRCELIRRVFWPTATDLREIRKGVAVLQGARIFEAIQVEGRMIVYRWSPEVFQKVAAEYSEGYAVLRVAKVSKFRSEYQFRMYELLTLHSRKRMPKFDLPGLPGGLDGAPAIPWCQVRQQWLTAASVFSAIYDQRFLFGVIRRRATGEVRRVVMKVENSRSQWHPGSLFAFSLDHGEHVEIVKMVGGIHRSLSDAEARQKRMAITIN